MDIFVCVSCCCGVVFRVGVERGLKMFRKLQVIFITKGYAVGCEFSLTSTVEKGVI